MAPRKQSAMAVFAELTLRHAIRLWPADSAEWGRALAAELGETQTPREALRWAFGGVTLFIRASIAHLLEWAKLPAGANSRRASDLSGGDPPRLPKHSRLVTALLLAGACCALLLPWGRESIAAVHVAWQLFVDWSPETGPAEALAKRAEREQDARKLAFAATAHPDPTRAMELASKAVKLDPSLTWIFASRFYRPEPPSDEASSDWSKQMQARDPGNGYVFLLAAKRSGAARFQALLENHSPSQEEIENCLASAPQWLPLMQSAVRAPRYESYSHLHLELVREIWSREKSLSPALVMYSMWTTVLPDPLDLKSFVNIRIREAKAAQADGRAEQSERILKELNAFGERMAAKDQTDFEKMMGLEVSQQSLTELNALYNSSQRTQDSDETLQQLRQLDSRRDAQIQSFQPSYDATVAPYHRKAVAVEVSLAILLLCGIVVGVSLAFLEMTALLPDKPRKRARRLACFAADYAPMTLILASAAFIFSFRPFALAFEQFRRGSGTVADARFLTGVFFTLGYVLRPPSGVSTAYFAWWAATILLALLAFLIFARSFFHRKPTH